MFGICLYEHNPTENNVNLFGCDGDLTIWESGQDQDMQNSYTNQYVYEPSC